MDKEIALTAIVCVTQIIIALYGRDLRTSVRALRRQQTAHNLYLSGVRDRLTELNIPGMPTMDQAEKSAGITRGRHAARP